MREDMLTKARAIMTKKINKGDARCILHPTRRAKFLAQWVEREPTQNEIVEIYVFAVCGVCSHRHDELHKRKMIEKCRDPDPRASCLILSSFEPPPSVQQPPLSSVELPIQPSSPPLTMT